MRSNSNSSREAKFNFLFPFFQNFMIVGLWSRGYFYANNIFLKTAHSIVRGSHKIFHNEGNQCLKTFLQRYFIVLSYEKVTLRCTVINYHYLKILPYSKICFLELYVRRSIPLSSRGSTSSFNKASL